MSVAGKRLPAHEHQRAAGARRGYVQWFQARNRSKLTVLDLFLKGASAMSATGISDPVAPAIELPPTHAESQRADAEAQR